MRILFLFTLLVVFVGRISCQVNSIPAIDIIALAVDNYSDFLCFKYSDTMQKGNQYSTRELIFLYNTRKIPDTLKIIELFLDSASLYSPIETRYYYVKGKPIKMVILRTNLVQEVSQSNVYFLKKSEIVQGATLPNLAGWSHKQSSEHMFNVYRRFIKSQSDQK